MASSDFYRLLDGDTLIARRLLISLHVGTFSGRRMQPPPLLEGPLVFMSLLGEHVLNDAATRRRGRREAELRGNIRQKPSRCESPFPFPDSYLLRPMFDPLIILYEF
jgi:hypothetical protein